MENVLSIDERLKNIESLLLSQKTVLNFDEVAVYTGLSKSYLYKMSARGDIPCYQPKGKLLYFDKSEIDRWLLSNKKKSSAESESEASTFVALKKGGAK